MFLQHLWSAVLNTDTGNEFRERDKEHILDENKRSAFPRNQKH